MTELEVITEDRETCRQLVASYATFGGTLQKNRGGGGFNLEH